MPTRSPHPRKLVLVLALLISLVLSLTVIRPLLSSPSLYSGTIRTLDKQKLGATGISLTVTAVSTALSAIPNDTGTPVATEIADLSFPLFLVLCLIYMEKFLLTTFGWFSSTILIPLACILKIIHLYFPQKELQVWIKKLVIIAVAIVLIIPVCTKVATLIESTFSESVTETLNAAHNLAEKTETDSTGNAFLDFFSSLKDNVVLLVDSAKNMLGILMDAVVILVVVNCIIPVITGILFLWILKTVLSLDFPIRATISNIWHSRRKYNPVQKIKEIKESLDDD